MFSHWSATLVAKMKAMALIGTSLAAGGVGGAMALSHVAPSGTTQIVRSADSSPAPASPDPETTGAQGAGTGDPETTGAQGAGTGDPETTDAQGSGSGGGSSSATGGYTLPPCPTDVKSHGQYVSSVAHSAPKGKHGEHGKWVSLAAQSDCGKHRAGSGPTDPESGSAQPGDPGSSGSSGKAKHTSHGHSGKHDSSPAPGSSGPTVGDSSGGQPAGHGHSGGHGAGHGHGGGGHSQP
jgi:hypothetical protein